MYAVADSGDRHHRACRSLLEDYTGALVVPTLVVGEVGYLIGSRLGPDIEARFLAGVAGGDVKIEKVSDGDWNRIAELAAQYRDLPLGTVDASVVAAAERLGATTIATLDRRDFSVIRPTHVDAFELVP